MIVAAARSLGLEGVIAKRKNYPYEPGERSGAWQKLELGLSQESIVGGYRPGFNAVDGRFADPPAGPLCPRLARPVLRGKRLE